MACLGTTERGLIQLVSDEFERRGWRSTGDLPVQIVRQALLSGRLDAHAAATLARQAFLLKNGVCRAEVKAALEPLFAGRHLQPDAPSTQGVIVQNHFSISGDNNVVSHINVGGQQFTLTSQSTKEQSLQAVEALVAQALADGWPSGGVTRLQDHLEARGDVTEPEIEQAAQRAIEAGNAKPGQLAQLRTSLMAGTVSGLLVRALGAAFGF
jgi:hypothetical protein